MHDSVLFQAGIFPTKGAARAHIAGHVKTAHPIFVGRIQGNYSWNKKKILGKSAHASCSFPNNQNFYMNRFKCFALTAATNKHSG